MVWYYARGGQRQGPVEDAEIQQLVASGQVGPGDLVWRSGLPDWRPAGEVPEIARFLRPAAAPTPPPPPPPVSYQPPSPYQPPASFGQAPAPYAQPQSPYAPPSAPLTQAPAYGPAPLPVPGPLSVFGAAPTTEYASFFLRLGAFVIDWLLVVVMVFILAFVFGMFMAIGGTIPTGEEAIWNLVGIVITWLYYASFESSSLMGTPGKRAFGLRVTDMQGQRVNFLRATGRHFGKMLSALFLLLGFLMMIFDDQKQTLHDKLASCLVLKQR